MRVINFNWKNGLKPVVAAGLLLMGGATISGCAVLGAGQECVKTIWGSSTRALEQARAKALTKVYAKPYWDLMRAAVLSAEKNRYVIFKKDEVKGYLVLMGIKGAVNTTEVGVFFVELGGGETRVEISSLSTNAKRFVAKALFHDLDIAAGLAPPDPELPPAETPSI